LDLDVIVHPNQPSNYNDDGSNKPNYCKCCQASKPFNLKTVHVFKLKKAEQRSPTLEDKLRTQIYKIVLNKKSAHF